MEENILHSLREDLTGVIDTQLQDLKALNMCPGLAFCETKHLLYVTNYTRFKSGRVSIFSEEGEYIKYFGQKQLFYPEGVVSTGITCMQVIPCTVLCSVTSCPIIDSFLEWVKWDLDRINFVILRISTYVASKGDVYLADCNNNRVVVMDCDLQFKQIIQHSSMTESIDLKFLKDELYVLSDSDNPVLHVFSKAGNKIRSLITHHS